PLPCFPPPLGFDVVSCWSAPTENPAEPSAFTATAYTIFWCSRNVTTDSFAFKSHTFAVLSRPAVTRYLPSADMAQPSTQSAWFSTVCSSFALSSPSDRSHTRTARSQPPAASRLPSGDTARHNTESSTSSRC